MKCLLVMVVSHKLPRILLMILAWSGLTTTTFYLWRNGVSVQCELGKNEYANIDRLTTSAVRNITFGLDDIFISVKTSGKFHASRLQVILKTWWNNCRNQTTFFSDEDDSNLMNTSGARILNTNCGNSHFRTHLCCKMGFEYDYFMNTGKKWWCHFDDDNYVNAKRLVKVLSGYDSNKDHYIGRPSLSYPISTTYIGRMVSFWFATGGAGICISKSLAVKMSKWSRNGRFRHSCNSIKLPDDCTLGFIINNRLGVNLTVREDFNSHLQSLKRIRIDEIASQVTLSHSADQGYLNVLNMQNVAAFSISQDPTRFLSLHCHLHPEIHWCPSKRT